MLQEAIVQYVSETFEGVNVVVATEGLPAGDTFFIYDPQRNLPPNRQMPFATIVTKDYGEFDNKSNLDRDGVWRLNIGLSRDTFKQLFPEDTTEYDYAQSDTLMPHPVYAPQSFVCVLNPSQATFEQLKPLLTEAYKQAAARRKPV
jgi:Family of unknown function (DUF6194)